jgi:hypothetical protein
MNAEEFERVSVICRKYRQQRDENREMLEDMAELLIAALDQWREGWRWDNATIYQDAQDAIEAWKKRFH